MNLSSKISCYKVNLLLAKIEVRKILNVAGVYSDEKLEKKKKEDVFEMGDLIANYVDVKDMKKIDFRATKYVLDYLVE